MNHLYDNFPLKILVIYSKSGDEIHHVLQIVSTIEPFDRFACLALDTPFFATICGLSADNSKPYSNPFNDMDLVTSLIVPLALVREYCTAHSFD